MAIRAHFNTAAMCRIGSRRASSWPSSAGPRQPLRRGGALRSGRRRGDLAGLASLGLGVPPHAAGDAERGAKGDRASVIFSRLDEISACVQKRCT